MSIFLLDEFEKTIAHDALYLDKVLEDKVMEKRGEQHLRDMGFNVANSEDTLDSIFLEAAYAASQNMSKQEKVAAYRQAIVEYHRM